MSIPLEASLDLKKVVQTGSILAINEDYFDETLTLKRHKSEETLVVDTLGGPPIKLFSEIASDMVTLDDSGFVRKKILEEGGGEVVDATCTVGIAYSGYFEGEDIPFDTRPPAKPMDCIMAESGLLRGLNSAVLTMRVGEVSMFLISYKVMYGKMGNPPKIKPKADCLFYIKLIRSRLTPRIEDATEEPDMFTRMYKECRSLYINGCGFHKNSNIAMAIRCFNRAVRIMHHVRLADEREERKQEEFLLKVYLNLAICYNHSKNPRRACCMCNEINRLSPIWKHGRALYQNAKALRMIGDFRGAERRLKRAMQLCPEMREEMTGEMNKLTEQVTAYEKSQLVASKALEERPRDVVSDEFKAKVDEIVAKFAADSDICKIVLPEALNQAELQYVKEMAGRHKISCDTFKKDVYLDKMSKFDEKRSVFDDS